MRGILISLVAVCTLSITNVAFAENIAQGVKVVVIDAGHGGPKFPGATYRGVHEKDLNLQVALKLGALIEKRMPDVTVVYTRKTDKQFSTDLNKDLQARAEIANKAGGDIFISIHANAARAAGARGVETLIMGESTLETRENENVLFANNKEEFLDMSNQKTAAIVRAYIQNLQFTYGEYSEMMARLIQKNYAKSGRVARGIKRQPLKVLYATDMPSVLTEIGFMSNSDELRYMTSERGQAQIAEDLYSAVKEYAEYVRKSLLVEGGSSSSASSGAKSAAAVSGKSGKKGTDADKRQKEGKAGSAASEGRYVTGAALAANAAESADEKSSSDPVAQTSGAAAATKTTQPAPLKSARSATGVQSAKAPAEQSAKTQQTTSASAAGAQSVPAKAAQPTAESADNTRAAASHSETESPAHFFAVQIMASATPLSADDARFGSFRGKVKCYTADGAYKYKYCIGCYSDKASAQKAAARIGSEFKGAFVVGVDGGRIAARK